MVYANEQRLCTIGSGDAMKRIQVQLDTVHICFCDADKGCDRHMESAVQY